MIRASLLELFLIEKNNHIQSITILLLFMFDKPFVLL